MLHAPEWVVAWRLRQAYALSDTDISCLIQSLADAGQVSLHQAWVNFKNFFLLPKIQSLPVYWRSTFDNLGYNSDGPLWTERFFGEKQNILDMLRVVAAQTDTRDTEHAINTLYGEIYESDTTPPVAIEDFCAPFFYSDGAQSQAFFERIFIDSVLFNKIAGIEYLSRACYPLVSEVKSITRELVETVRLKLRQHSTPLSSQEPPAEPEAALPPQSMAEAEAAGEKTGKQISAWWEEAGTRKGAEKKACLLAKAKWQGMSHTEAYDTINPGNNSKPDVKKSYVNKARASAQEIASESKDKLELPPWRTG